MASPQLKALENQVIVITGASSGIGLATAREAARRGGRVVLAARNADALDAIVADLREQGARAIAVEADVSKEQDVRRIAEAAFDVFGRIDSWVNNAGLSLYGEFEEVSIKEQKRLFDINYWGVVNGTREALRRIRGPGAIINLGSVLSQSPMPLQSAYVASKHAVKGFTDSVRIETERQGRPISITLVKPAAIDTPFADHARSHDEATPDTPPPRYSPQLVAETISHACETPVRETFVGSAAPGFALLSRMAPGAYDWMARKFMVDQQRRPPAAEIQGARDNLYGPREDGHERSQHPKAIAARRAHAGRGAALPLAAALATGAFMAWAMRRAGEPDNGGAQTAAGARRIAQTPPANIPSEPLRLARVE